MSALAIPVEEKSVVAQGLEAFGVTQYVCSLHFMPIKVSRDYRTKMQGGYSTTYNLAAVQDTKARPFVLSVLDAYQRVYQGADRLPKWANTPILALDIAKDIVNVATGSGDPSADLVRPAVWISQASRVPRTEAEWSSWGKPEFAAMFPEFAQECQQYARRQWLYAEKKVAEAATFYSKKLLMDISNIHRKAAAYIGANKAEHEWIEPTSHGEIIQCPICGAKTSSAHPKCQGCHEVINKQLYDKIKADLAKG